MRRDGGEAILITEEGDPGSSSPWSGVLAFVQGGRHFGGASQCRPRSSGSTRGGLWTKKDSKLISRRLERARRGLHLHSSAPGEVERGGGCQVPMPGWIEEPQSFREATQFRRRAEHELGEAVESDESDVRRRRMASRSTADRPLC